MKSKTNKGYKEFQKFTKKIVPFIIIFFIEMIVSVIALVKFEEEVYANIFYVGGGAIAAIVFIMVVFGTIYLKEFGYTGDVDNLKKPQIPDYDRLFNLINLDHKDYNELTENQFNYNKSHDIIREVLVNKEKYIKYIHEYDGYQKLLENVEKKH